VSLPWKHKGKQDPGLPNKISRVGGPHKCGVIRKSVTVTLPGEETVTFPPDTLHSQVRRLRLARCATLAATQHLLTDGEEVSTSTKKMKT